MAFSDGGNLFHCRRCGHCRLMNDLLICLKPELRHMRSLRVPLLAFLFVFFFSAPLIAENFYKWVDEKGIPHFSDSLTGIPPEYQNQVKTNKFKKVDKPPVQTQSKDSAADSKDSSSEEKQKRELKKYKVPYMPYEGTARRIIIQVTFNGSVTAPMLLDTGAPGMLISSRLADKLGLFDKNNGNLLIEAGGIGGSVPAIRTIIDTVQVGEAKDNFIPTTIAKSISGSFEGLIGMDFMANFNISIDTRKHLLIFEEIPSQDKMPAGHGKKWWKTTFLEFSYYRTRLRDWSKDIKKQIRSSDITVNTNINKLEKLKKFADRQLNESEKLFKKLDRYAAKHAVPKHWRKY